jgi:hypothetical protein
MRLFMKTYVSAFISNASHYAFDGMKDMLNKSFERK